MGKRYKPESTANILVTQGELADWLDLSAPGVCTNAHVIKDGNKYKLKESIQAYCRYMRGLKKSDGAEVQGRVSLNDELTRWRIESEKRKDADWRRQECREMAEGLIAGLLDDVGRLRDVFLGRGDTEVVGLLQTLMDDIAGTQPEDIIPQEGNDEG